MYLHQIILYIVLFVLIYRKESRYGSFIIVIEQIIYILFILNLPGESYFFVCALSNLIVGEVLIRKYKAAAFFSYLMIFVNIYGYAIWYLYYDPVSYDIICAIVFVLQLISITFPRVQDGIFGVCRGIFISFIQRIAVSVACFDSYKAYATMFKNTSTKKES